MCVILMYALQTNGPERWNKSIAVIIYSSCWIVNGNRNGKVLDSFTKVKPLYFLLSDLRKASVTAAEVEQAKIQTC